jgi:hypothetical protein
MPEKLTLAQEERISFLEEATSNLLSAVCRVFRHGLDGQSGEGSGEESAQQRLEKELAAVQGATALLIRSGDVDVKRILLQTQVYSAQLVSKYRHQNDTGLAQPTAKEVEKVLHLPTSWDDL